MFTGIVEDLGEVQAVEQLGDFARIHVLSEVVTADARPSADDQAPQTSAPGAPVQSFTEVLSAQRAQSPHDGEDRHDADAKRDPAHGEGTASAKGGRPSPSPAPGQAPAATPVSTAHRARADRTYSCAASTVASISTAPCKCGLASWAMLMTTGIVA